MFSLVFIALICLTICQKDYEITRKILNNFLDGSPKELFKVWHFLFERTYTLDTQEARERFVIFKQNLKLIKEHNAGNFDYKLGVNNFSDMTNEEFKAKMCTKKVVKGEDFDRMIDNMKVEVKFLPDDDDLTKRNLAYTEIDYTKYFSAVRDQGTCGSCWAFSTTGTVEGNLGLRSQKAFPYTSPQQLIDCDKSNKGCNGGVYGGAYNYVKLNGIYFDADYTYKSNQGTCKYDKNKATNKIQGSSYCSNYSGQTSRKCSIDKVYTLLKSGPVSVGIDAGSSQFQSYKSGIFTYRCSEDNHAVILMGYGISGSQQYWLVRNSWSARWGINGYIKVAVNDANAYSCFVNNEAWLPTF